MYVVSFFKLRPFGIYLEIAPGNSLAFHYMAGLAQSLERLVVERKVACSISEADNYSGSLRNEGTPSVLQTVYNKPRQHWRSCFQYRRHKGSVLTYFLAKYTDTQLKSVWGFCCCYCCCCFFLHASTLKRLVKNRRQKITTA